MILRRERHVREGMMYRQQYLIADRRVFIEFGRFLCVDAVGSVDDLALDGEFAYVVQVTRDGDAFDLFFAPAEFGGDDLREFADANRVALGVFVLAVDGRGKRFYRVVICRAHFVKEFAVLVRVTLDLGHQIALSNSDADVPAHRADDLFVVMSVDLAGRLFAEKQRADDLVTHDKRNK